MANFENTVNGSIINGTAENDTIVNNADNVTIYGYAGDDSIENSATVCSDDYGNWATVTANNVIIQSGEGNDYVSSGGYEGSTFNVTIDAGAGNDTLSFFGDNLSVNAGIGDDSVQPMKIINSVIYLDEGNDRFHSYGGNNFTINGGNGDDDIDVGCIYPEKIVGIPPENVMVIAGDGNDAIRNEGTNSTIMAGKGNDTIDLSGRDGGSLSSFYYNLGDGDDKIRDYTTADTLNISGASYSAATVDNNVVITVGEGTDSVGTITLINAAGTALNVASDGGSTDSDGETTDTVPSGETTETSTDKAYDIAFLIDNTGSMWDYIDNVKNNVTTFTNSLGNIDYRLGLVEFGDIYDSEIKKYEFTAYSDEFLADLNAIELTGGADLPESGLEALTEGMTMNFRDNAEKRFIVVTDANYHNQGDEEGDGDMSAYLYVDDVVGALKEKNIIVDVVGTTYEKYETDSAQSEWDEAIAQATGGKFYDIDSDFPTLIKDIAGEITGGGQMKLSNWSYHFNFPEADSATPVLTTSAT